MPLSSQPGFEYSPLPSSTGYIRLVTILPESDDLIRCSLEQYSVTSLPQFDALSYTWNLDPSDEPSSIDVSERRQDRRVIIVNKSCFRAQHNLYLGLKELRRGGQSLPIWVDAICINQHDHHEKGHQVNSMSRIYSSAQTVHAWLGPLKNDLRLVSNFIQNRQSSAADYNKDILKSLERVGKRSYWHRAWIRQEIILAKTVRVHCGTVSYDWKTFVAAFRDADCIDVVRHARGDRFAKFLHGRYTREVSALLNIDSERKETTQGQEKRSDLFIRALLRFGLAQAKDPRDRVYALLSLHIDTADPSSLQADYGMSRKQLFFAVLGFHRTKYKCACAELGGHLIQVLELNVGDMTPLILGTQPIIDEIDQITYPTNANHHLILQFLKDFREAAEYTKPTANWTSDRDRYPKRLCSCFLAACSPNKLGPQLCISDRLFYIRNKFSRAESTVALIMRPSIIGLIVSGIATPNGYKQSKYQNLGVPMACVNWSKLPSIYYNDIEGRGIWALIPEMLLANAFNANQRRRSKFLEAFKQHPRQFEPLPETIVDDMVKENDQTGHTFLRLATKSLVRFDRKKVLCETFLPHLDHEELSLNLICAILESGRTRILGRTYPSNNPRSACFDIFGCARLMHEYSLNLVDVNESFMFVIPLSPFHESFFTTRIW